jgi:hypothetical protein
LRLIEWSFGAQRFTTVNLSLLQRTDLGQPR